MLAARFGMGSLGFGFETPHELAERTNEYYRIVREECFPIGHAINPGLAVLTTFMMGHDGRGSARTQAPTVRPSSRTRSATTTTP